MMDKMSPEDMQKWSTRAASVAKWSKRPVAAAKQCYSMALSVREYIEGKERA